MDEMRPDPGRLLNQIESDEQREQRGKLKVFLGYAAGVGKTYAMLDAAHAAQKAGTDVVVGYVEPHTRPDTLALIEGLESLPPREIEYKGIVLREFDLDAALARHPELIIVDELAHTNAKGCRHKKRYSDIEELLRAGIDVYTTVNIQHLESLNDIVCSITQVKVQERVPDYLIDQAAQVELIDIAPEVLIERLSEGKIYAPEQAEKALKNFFTLENLIALREIAMRRTADRVSIRNIANARGDYFTSEHILIGISAAPSNARVIRAAARMASAFHGVFTALYVETQAADELQISKGLQANIKLAEQLGAKIVTVYGEDIPAQIAEYAKVSNVSKIVVGRSGVRKGVFGARPALVDRLSAIVPNLDIYIIPDHQNREDYRPRKKAVFYRSSVGIDLLKTVAILAATTLLGLFFYSMGFRDASIVTCYILAVLLVSYWTDRRVYGILASVVGVLLYNFLFTVPRFTFNAIGPEYPITFIVMLLAALITSALTRKVKNQARTSAINAHRTEILLETSKKLHRADGLDGILDQAALQIRTLLGRSVVVYPEREGKLQPPKVYAMAEEEQTDAYIAEAEQAVAAWVYRNKKPAGMTTDTLPGAELYYLPIYYQEHVQAVVGLALAKDVPIEPFARSLLRAMLGEIAFAIEKYDLIQQRERAAMRAEKESLRANMLRAISHDLRTPLTSISGNASILLSDFEHVDPGDRDKLLQNIYDDSMWLINLVENLLAVTRIDNGTLNLQLQPELLEDVLSEALTHIDRASGEHTIKLHLPQELLMVLADARLIIQVMINLINNAIKYTDKGSHIDITGYAKGKWVVVEVADDGDGIADKDKENIFEMFYTAENGKADSRRGMGLGLALCKSIVKAHGGRIYVRDNQPRGAVLGFTLKKVEVTDETNKNFDC